MTYMDIDKTSYARCGECGILHSSVMARTCGECRPRFKRRLCKSHVFSILNILADRTIPCSNANGKWVYCPETRRA